ncbi:hypothetical protein [Anditalea andensis]|uniref:Transmembrane protein n=1 Tax=Anditalea andensis TaxID=1048983 RepID=A0A074L2E6_9BACT|nr:hypothetical protein [Anditalea andensis]KEO74043.1 hypothetical protein EL17_07805 [Anditalea andensis]
MEIFGAIIVALVISSIFYFAVDVRGPWGSFWTFFIIVLLVVWAASLWIVPFGYIYWEIAWIPLFFIGLVIAFLLAALTSTPPDKLRSNSKGSDIVNTEKEPERTYAAIGLLFWVFIGLMLVAIIAGYATDPRVNVTF